MAKLLDKLYNRVIEGELLELSDEEIQKLGLAKASEVGSKLYLHNVACDITNEDGDAEYSFILKILSKVSSSFTSLKQALEKAEFGTGREDNNENIVLVESNNIYHLDSSPYYLDFSTESAFTDEVA